MPCYKTGWRGFVTHCPMPNNLGGSMYRLKPAGPKLTQTGCESFANSQRKQPNYMPVPANTTPTVRAMILKSSQMLQLSM